jgi:hypothetical protein
MAGATQIKAPCPHVDDRPRDVCMHSEISQANADKWEAGRLPEGVGESELRELLDVLKDDATVAVCNSCRRINRIVADDVEVLHSGDPHFDDRVGEWLIDLDEADEEPAFGDGSR